MLAMNELLWFGFAIVNFGLFLFAYKWFGKTGIFCWIAIATVLANVQVTKSITLFGINATLGNIMYGTIFLATDALNELFGPKEAKKAVLMGFFVLVVTMAVMQLALLFQPNDQDFAQDSLTTIFGFLPRIALASMTAFLMSQFFDVTIFQKIRRRWPDNRYLWLRNNGSTFLSQLLDTLIFVPIAFVGVYSLDIVFQIFISTYIIKIIVALLDTPCLYLIKTIKPL